MACIYGLWEAERIDSKRLFFDVVRAIDVNRLIGRWWYCFLDGYSEYNQISIAPEDQQKSVPLILVERLYLRLCLWVYTRQNHFLMMYDVDILCHI